MEHGLGIHFYYVAWDSRADLHEFGRSADRQRATSNNNTPVFEQI